MYKTNLLPPQMEKLANHIMLISVLREIGYWLNYADYNLEYGCIIKTGKETYYLSPECDESIICEFLLFKRDELIKSFNDYIFYEGRLAYPTGYNGKDTADLYIKTVSFLYDKEATVPDLDIEYVLANATEDYLDMMYDMYGKDILSGACNKWDEEMVENKGKYKFDTIQVCTAAILDYHLHEEIMYDKNYLSLIGIDKNALEKEVETMNADIKSNGPYNANEAVFNKDNIFKRFSDWSTFLENVFYDTDYALLDQYTKEALKVFDAKNKVGIFPDNVVAVIRKDLNIPD